LGLLATLAGGSDLGKNGGRLAGRLLYAFGCQESNGGVRLALAFFSEEILAFEVRKMVKSEGFGGFGWGLGITEGIQRRR